MNKLNKKIRDLKKERYLMLTQDNRVFYFEELKINRNRIRELTFLKNLIKSDTVILLKGNISIVDSISIVDFIKNNIIKNVFETENDFMYINLKYEFKILNFDKSEIEWFIYKDKVDTKINIELLNEDNSVYKDFGVSDLSYNDYLYIKDKCLKCKILSELDYFSIRIIFNEEYYKLLEYWNNFDNNDNNDKI